MKKRLISIISLMLVLVMVLAMAVACKKNDPVIPDDDDGDGDGTGGGGTGGKEEVTAWYDDVKFTNTELVIQLSNCTKDTELPVGGDKYMKGPDAIDSTGANSLGAVENEVYKRNRAAVQNFGFTLKYVYCDKEWNYVRSYIAEQENNYGSSEKVDLYCDMLYDMEACAVENGIFANLLKYTAKDSGVDGWEAGAGFFDIAPKNGYNVNFMDDMALSENRKVLIASDYFMDVLRAMTMMPFNKDIYTGVVAVDDPDAERLYQMALDGQWTWDALMSFQDVATSEGASTIDDDRILIPLACGGLTASALLYSTAFEGYTERVVGDTTYYKLENSCNKLVQLFQKAGQLAGCFGVVVVGGSDVQSVETANAKFTSGESLFATPNMLGIVESDAFQEMSGLSIMPVPMLDDQSESCTMINSRARVGALSFHSTKKAAMSAFVQYSSEKSETVKNKYFDTAMKGQFLVGSNAGQILTKIYTDLGNGKYAILENLILAKDWNVGKENCWTQLLKQENFTKYASQITTKYSACINAKQAILDGVSESWANAQ